VLTSYESPVDMCGGRECQVICTEMRLIRWMCWLGLGLGRECEVVCNSSVKLGLGLVNS